MDFTHFDENGNARMVDVSEKSDTERIAVAKGAISVSRDVFDAVRSGKIAKGDVLTVATTAGIMGLKNTSSVIPMCHIIPLTHAGIQWELEEKDGSCEILCTCTVKCTGKTGVEMESLTAVSVAALTIYDMCKAVQRDIRISDIQLEYKAGGKSGEYKRG